jgi:eukaryotic-like serine/threonine-protein kinase
MTEASIFAAALEKTTDQERAAYLAEACAGNEKLRRRVEALLRAHAQSDEILDAAMATVDEVPLTERPGLRIGPYRLMEQIGEGGFGLVFVAEQTEPVRRKVALKVLKPGMDSAQVIARFEAERQALALMDHPNIARVLDAGATDSGRPYFVMELVKGIPITEYCDENQLTPSERLALFVSVCQAVQHAHQKGVIHRDLKPSNVLVTSHDGKPVAKVIDFGIAKAIHQQLTERTLYTNMSQMIGTPLYMSPEQAGMSGLDIDTRSDIYSLGVLLYELLTGTTPLEQKRFAQAAYEEIRRLIREEEPPRPSQRLSTSETLPSIAANRKMEPARLTRLLRGELDWIVMKCLEKDRTRRYETASALARDVEHYLADELVEARPPSLGYRLQKFARKHRTTLTTAAALFLLLVGGVAASLWQAQKARAAAEAENVAKTTAEAREAETRAVLDFVDKKIFTAARPEGQEGGLGRDVTLRRAIEAALPEVETNFSAQPLIEARLRMTVGSSYLYLGETKIAIDQFQKARALYTQHLGPEHPDTLLSMKELGWSFHEDGRMNEALKLLEKTLDLQEKTLGRDHPDTLTTKVCVGCTYKNLGQPDNALKHYQEALELNQATLGPNDRRTLWNMDGLATCYSVFGQHEKAIDILQKTLPLQLATLTAKHDDTVFSMVLLAEEYARLRRFPEAIPRFQEALNLQQSKLGADHPHTLSTMWSLANTYVVAGREAEASKLFEDLIPRQEKKFGPKNPASLWTMNDFANLLASAPDLKVRNPARAVKLAQRMVELAPDELEFVSTRGIARYQAGDSKGAKADLQESIKLRSAKKPNDYWDQSGDAFFLAMALWRLGEKREAHEWYDKGVQWTRKLGADESRVRERDRAEAAALLGIEKKQ